jgi:hypothetical protein
VGVTTFVPEGPVTVPTPWLMERDVAPLVVQARVALWPRAIVAGVTVKELIATLGARTVTVAVAVELPEALLAVSVYVVVAVGVTTFVVPVTIPMPGLMARLIAPDTLQLRVLLCPAVRDAGDAAKAAIVGVPKAPTDTVTDAVTLPVALVAVST